MSLFEIKDNNIIYLYKTDHLEIVTWEIFKNKFLKNNSENWHTNHAMFCFRKSAIIEAGNYDKNIRFAEDVDLTARVLKKYGKIYNIKIFPVLYLYRQVGNSLCNGEDKIILRENAYKILYEKIYEYINN
jgi:hypothetical protein